MGVWSVIDGDRLELGQGEIIGGDGAPRAWRRRRDAQGIDWLLLDQPDASTNRVDAAMLEELDRLLAEIERDRPKGVVLRSAKRNGFIVGADIAQFRGADNAGTVETKIRRAHEVTDRLAALPVPTIAVIHGFCLGGGLELALACHWRIALRQASLGFPEVQLGVHPGLGGTARLTRLIDPIEAMTMMLTGRAKDARQALKAGLVDVVTDERHVAAAVEWAVSGKLKRQRSGSLRRSLLTLAPARRFLANRMRSMARRRAKPDHYPAPSALIDLWEKHGGNFAAMKAAEIASFSRLLVTPTAQNLIRVFFLREKMREGGKDASAIAHVHVIGAGTMGGDIAAWCALQGLKVTLADMSLKALGSAIERAAKLYERQRKGSAAVRDALDRLTADPQGLGASHADLIIEAVPENLDLKRRIYADLEIKMKPTAILATNTSSIPLESLCEGLKRPERLIGIHFFNPVAQMQLVEVVHHAGVSAETLVLARGFTSRIDRLPALVKSAPGFLVNRALMPYLLEAMLLFGEGVAPEAVDAAAEGFGMPMGPMELADQIGLDICLDVAKELRRALTTPLPDLPPAIVEKVAKGELGRKTGRGIYTYKNGKPQKQEIVSPNADLVDRLILPLVNTCAACLREGVVADEEIVDGAMIFGTGFAPFRGGPMCYARTRGIADVRSALDALAARLGERFAPDLYWQGHKG